MQEVTTAVHHPEDPRRLAREAVAAGNVEVAKVWAAIATAEALHRVAKAITGEVSRGVTRLPHEHPAESEQAA